MFFFYSLVKNIIRRSRACTRTWVMTWRGHIRRFCHQHPVSHNNRHKTKKARVALPQGSTLRSSGAADESAPPVDWVRALNKPCTAFYSHREPPQRGVHEKEEETRRGGSRVPPKVNRCEQCCTRDDTHMQRRKGSDRRVVWGSQWECQCGHWWRTLVSFVAWFGCGAAGGDEVEPC